MQMQRAALIGAVEFNARHFAAQDFDVVVAVDRGFATCQAQGIEPDVVVGDFDSLGYVPSGIDVQEHSSVKDESDMELALRLASNRGCDEMLVYGALSDRLDHTLANLQLMAGLAGRGKRVAGIGGDFAVVALTAGEGCIDEVSFAAFDPAMLDAGAYGRFVSVFAMGGDARAVSEHGLRYSLEGATLPCMQSLGLSNEFTGEQAVIRVQDGVLLVTFSIDAWPHMRLGATGQRG